MTQVFEQARKMSDAEEERYELVRESLVAMSCALDESNDFDVPARFRFPLLMAAIDLRVRASIHLEVLQWAASVIKSLPIEPIQVDRILKFHCLDGIGSLTAGKDLRDDGDSAT